MTRTILVVEDEVAIATSVQARLWAEGFKVEIAHDGPTAVDTFERCNPDLVILDVMLPGFDGLEVCRRIQAKRPVPVIMLTARDSERDVLLGLGIGADDYVKKPFSVRELVARVHSLLRRFQRAGGNETADEVVVGDLTINTATREVVRGNISAHFTPIEFDLLLYFARRPGAVCSREQLLADVWGFQGYVSARTVDAHIAALRRKLGADVVKTVHGVGYALEVIS